MNTIEFNKHDVDIFINGMWQKYAGNIRWLFKITRLLELRIWPTRNRSQPLQGNYLCKKWVSLLRISDIRNRFRCVCFLQFDWLIFLGNYYHVGFKKGREAGLMLETENNKLNIYKQYHMKSTFETIWLFFHRPVGLVELLILYARVQFYTPQASDYRLNSKTVPLTVTM
jgi:hypothetical protein